jgi:predicted GNAT family N-acyltransferase
MRTTQTPCISWHTKATFLIGTARLLPSGEIGRVSVLKDWRGLKVGDALMEAVIGEAEKRGQTNSCSARRLCGTVL